MLGKIITKNNAKKGNTISIKPGDNSLSKPIDIKNPIWTVDISF